MTLVRIPLDRVPQVLTTGEMVELSPIAGVALALAHLGVCLNREKRGASDEANDDPGG